MADAYVMFECTEFVQGARSSGDVLLYRVEATFFTVEGASFRAESIAPSGQRNITHGSQHTVNQVRSGIMRAR